MQPYRKLFIQSLTLGTSLSKIQYHTGSPTMILVPFSLCFSLSFKVFAISSLNQSVAVRLLRYLVWCMHYSLVSLELLILHRIDIANWYFSMGFTHLGHYCRHCSLDNGGYWPITRCKSPKRSCIISSYNLDLSRNSGASCSKSGLCALFFIDWLIDHWLLPLLWPRNSTFTRRLR